MNDEAKQPDNVTPEVKPTDGSGQDPTAQVPPAPPPLKKIVVANGEEVTLQPYQSAIVIMKDRRDGSLGIYDVQNCPNRSEAKSLLNDALDHYRAAEVAASTVSMMANLAAKTPKKSPIFNPFGKKE
jgi:hypothetical protein